MHYKSYVFLITYLFINHVLGSEEGSDNNTVFIPTRDWQVVKKGTPIPRGLHVRHDFQTGITEAKLLDPEESSDSNTDETHRSLVIHPEAIQTLSENDNEAITFDQDDKSAKISPEELKAKLKKIKLSKAPFASKAEHADAHDQKINSQSMDELKKKFENISFGKSANSDLLATFIEQFNNHRNAIASGSLSTDGVKVIMDMLSQLEYMVHDIDNGLEFTKSGGLVKVIYPCLNGSIEEIKLEALHVLGAAVQSNPKVKEVVLELEFVPGILRTLTQHGNPKLMDRCIYALGSLLRHYPAAQKVFFNHGGLEIFSQVLAEGPVSAQKRIINLINDLILETQELNDIDTDLQNEKSKTQELEERIKQHKFCTQLGKLLVRTTRNDINTDLNVADYDLLEAIYECTLTAVNICKLEFRQSENEISTALNEISNIYNNSDPESRSDDNDILLHLISLATKIKTTLFNELHDEL